MIKEENIRVQRVEDGVVEQEVKKIRLSELKRALKRMKSRKGIGPDEVLKFLRMKMLHAESMLEE